MLGKGIVLWINADAGDSEVLGGGNDSYRNFAAVGDE
jgi:hypothetical protein